MRRYLFSLAVVVLALVGIAGSAAEARADHRQWSSRGGRGYYQPHYYGGSSYYAPYRGHYAPYRSYSYAAPYSYGYTYPGFYAMPYSYGYPSYGFSIQTPSFGIWLGR